MQNADPSRRRYQYSLRSLMAFATFIAVLCSIGTCTTWSVPIAIFGGLCVSFVGFRPLSFQRHPAAGDAFAALGFLVRLSGLLLISYGLLLFVAKVVWHREHFLP